MEHLKKQIKILQLSDYEEKITNLANPCIKMLAEETDSEVGCSKFGGHPDLPENIIWPMNNDTPMSFVVQINFEELQDYNINQLLPETGLLYYFYDYEAFAWGSAPEDKDCWKAIYVERNDILSPRKAPIINSQEEFPQSENFIRSLVNKFIKNKKRKMLLPTIFKEQRIRFINDITLPDATRKESQALNLPDDYVELYCDLVFNLSSNDKGKAHWLLGYPFPIQNDTMEEECYYPGENKSKPEEWMLLMQIDSDPATDFMWGDCGILYIWIKKDDLAVKNFQNIWTILQCH
jgi:uncharacterized protein YwqG